MESAIPSHLTQERTEEKRMPKGFQPPNPAWVARFSPLVDNVVMAYFGMQSRDIDCAPAMNVLTARFEGQNHPQHWERARYIDAQGYDTVIAIAYWSNPVDFGSWRISSGFDTWWNDDERLYEHHGYFLEVVTCSADRLETLRSSPDTPEGVARLEHHVSGEVEEHAYWGSMRDRLPIAQTDPLNSVLSKHVGLPNGTLAQRIVMPGRENLSLIRSGQDWSATKGQERDLYLNDIQPILRNGMNFLRDEGMKIGCLSCRYMTVLDDDGRPTEKTFGLAYFDKLANLESWARTHPTHLAIFGSFQSYVQKLNFEIALRLYHEVSVISASGQCFEYLNCHPQTGMLATAES
jgi:aldoxime dehydratase